jgi:hypothetical protein
LQIFDSFIERARQFHEDADIGTRFSERRRGDDVQSRDRGEMRANRDGVAWVCSDSCSDRGRAKIGCPQTRHDALKARAILRQREGERIEFLPTAHFEHSVEPPVPVAKRLAQVVECREQTPDRQAQADLERGPVGGVRALAAVDMMVRVEMLIVALGIARQLQPAIGNDLVHVHVGRRARTALHDVNDELRAVLAVLDLLADMVNQAGFLAIEHAKLGIRACRCLLHAGVSENEVRVD